MATIAEFRQRIADLQELIPGVAIAFPRPPKSIIGANMPLFVNVLGDADNDREFWGTQDTREGRLFRMLLYVAPISGGDSEGEIEALVEPWFDDVRNFFNARPNLRDAALTSNVELTDFEIAVVEGDGGSVALGYTEDQTKYAGIEFRLRVFRRHHVTFAAYN